MARIYLWFLSLLMACSLCVQALPPLKAGKGAWPKGHVRARSIYANQKALQSLQGMIRTPRVKLQNPLQRSIPKTLSRKVFQLQISPVGRHTATGFALQRKGAKPIGVTAGHVMENIRRDPYIKFTAGTETLLIPIESFRIGNKTGNDVAVFEIPDELLPHVQPFTAAEKRPTAGSVIESPRFLDGTPAYITGEDILFSGPHRILIRDRSKHCMTGSCGAPILVDGKVVGVSVGIIPNRILRTAHYNELLDAYEIDVKDVSLHAAAPMDYVFQLADQMQSPGAEPAPATALKVFGQEIYSLSAQERLVDVAQLRNGYVQAQLNAHPFMNFEALESFFELEENDVLRITVNRPKTATQREQILIFDVNVSTGEMTQGR